MHKRQTEVLDKVLEHTGQQHLKTALNHPLITKAYLTKVHNIIKEAEEKDKFSGSGPDLKDAGIDIIEQIAKKYEKLVPKQKLLAILLAVTMGTGGLFALTKIMDKVDKCLKPCDQYLRKYVFPLFGITLGSSLIRAITKNKVAYVISMLSGGALYRVVSTAGSKLAIYCILLCRQEVFEEKLNRAEVENRIKDIEKMKSILRKNAEHIKVQELSIQVIIRKLKIKGKNTQAKKIENAYKKVKQRKF